MRTFALILIVTCLPLIAHAMEAPAAQIPLDTSKVLRGHFTEEHQINGTPVQSSGHFTVTPGRGLIWGIEKPFPTSTIITPSSAAQDLGGLALKLPAKNLRHLYDVIGGALQGDWSGLETDFIITSSTKGKNWQMILTPRNTDKPKLSYTTITINGSRFVETIVMTRADGATDALSFTNTVLSSSRLSSQETALFNEVGQ